MSSRAFLLLLGLVTVACSSSTELVKNTDAGALDTGTPAAPFELKSTAFESGAALPALYTCNGKDVSPPLAWGPGPEGTRSYAIVVNDTSFKFLHAIIYDIPATTLALPENVEKKAQPAEPAGSRQVKSFRMAFGYAGPCPPKPRENTYEFVLYAVGAASLTAITDASTLQAAEAEIKKNALGSVGLTATYKQP
jgi:Raf kinase inhibitor-like YbhB/YbcL family protein